MIPARLKKAVEMMDPCKTSADIGCDHGYLSIEILKGNKAEKAILSDLREGPLQRAKENIRAAGLSDRAELRLSDGLSGLKKGEADTVFIMGMGGHLMERILSGRLGDFKNFILSPQSETEHFRRFLIENGMEIKKDTIIKDKGKYYWIMLSEMSGGHPKELSEIQYLFGKDPVNEGSPVLKEYLLKEKKRLEAIAVIGKDTEKYRERVSKALGSI